MDQVDPGGASIAGINPLSAQVDGDRKEGRPAFCPYVPLSVLKHCRLISHPLEIPPLEVNYLSVLSLNPEITR